MYELVDGLVQARVGYGRGGGVVQELVDFALRFFFELDDELVGFFR